MFINTHNNNDFSGETLIKNRINPIEEKVASLQSAMKECTETIFGLKEQSRLELPNQVHCIHMENNTGSFCHIISHNEAQENPVEFYKEYRLKSGQRIENAFVISYKEVKCAWASTAGEFRGMNTSNEILQDSIMLAVLKAMKEIACNHKKGKCIHLCSQIANNTQKHFKENYHTTQSIVVPEAKTIESENPRLSRMIQSRGYLVFQ